MPLNGKVKVMTAEEWAANKRNWLARDKTPYVGAAVRVSVGDTGFTGFVTDIKGQMFEIAPVKNIGNKSRYLALRDEIEVLS